MLQTFSALQLERARRNLFREHFALCVDGRYQFAACDSPRIFIGKKGGRPYVKLDYSQFRGILSVAISLRIPARCNRIKMLQHRISEKCPSRTGPYLQCECVGIFED